MSGPSVWQRALRLLARREHSRAELAHKLAPHGTPEEIEETLSRLERTGLLSDERCARAFVAARAERSGRRLLEMRLRERGLDDALIDEVLDALRPNRAKSSAPPPCGASASAHRPPTPRNGPGRHDFSPAADSPPPSSPVCCATRPKHSPNPFPTPNPESPMSLLHVERLRKTYGKRTVVASVDLTVEAGEIVGLLGPNGAGKTTCFYMIVGLVRADDGKIELDGQDVTHEPIHRRARHGLSYLPQEASIFRRLSVRENVRAVLELRGLPKDDIRQKEDGLLAELGIAHLADQPSVSLSGGERRRLEIARALATDPKIILLDEPFAGVDPIAVIEIQRIVRFLQKRGISVLITDHNVRETLGICNRASILADGRVIASGRPEEIIDDPHVRRVYLGEHFRL